MYAVATRNHSDIVLGSGRSMAKPDQIFRSRSSGHAPRDQGHRHPDRHKMFRRVFLTSHGPLPEARRCEEHFVTDGQPTPVGLAIKGSILSEVAQDDQSERMHRVETMNAGFDRRRRRR